MFGEASYKFGQFKLTAGGRYYDFKETRNSTPAACSPTDDNRTDKTKSNGFSPRGIVSWEPSRNFSVNVQAAKGFRLGGVNDPLNVPLCTPQRPRDFRRFPDVQGRDAVELRSRRQIFEAGLTFNAAAFYNEIRNLQVTLDRGQLLVAHRVQRAKGAFDGHRGRAFRPSARRASNCRSPAAC